MEEKNYYKIDVHGSHGYSFMVSSQYNLTDDEILQECKDKDIFDDMNDADYATIDREVDDYDISAFMSIGIYDLDE